jgi:hypothetical protein
MILIYITLNNYNPIINNYILIYDYNKPLKPISNYKLSELYTIAKMLNIKFSDKLKKQEMYAMLENIYKKTLNDWIII